MLNLNTSLCLHKSYSITCSAKTMCCHLSPSLSISTGLSVIKSIACLAYSCPNILSLKYTKLQFIPSSMPLFLPCLYDSWQKLAEYEDKIEVGDLIKVVRCKDCKWLVPSEKTNRLFCGWHSDGDLQLQIFENDYCNEGERR